MDGRGRIAKAGKFCKQNVARPYNKIAIFLWLLLKQFSCKFFEGLEKRPKIIPHRKKCLTTVLKNGKIKANNTIGGNFYVS